ncbi:fimbrial protein [Salmonella enterica]|nr:fimbrial protein [Salmonella enterica]
MLNLQRMILAGVLVSSSQISFALTDTASITATFNSTIESGTCKAVLHDDAGNLVDTLDFGNMYISEFNSNKPTKNFSIALNDCLAVTKVTIAPSSSSLCTNGDGQEDAFANTNGDAKGIAVELWSGEPDAGTKFICSQSSGQNFSVTDDTTILPMSIRMIPTETTLQAGSFDTTLTLIVTYP